MSGPNIRGARLFTAPLGTPFPASGPFSDMKATWTFVGEVNSVSQEDQASAGRVDDLVMFEDTVTGLQRQLREARAKADQQRRQCSPREVFAARLYTAGLFADALELLECADRLMELDNDQVTRTVLAMAREWDAGWDELVDVAVEVAS